MARIYTIELRVEGAINPKLRYLHESSLKSAAAKMVQGAPVWGYEKAQALIYSDDMFAGRKDIWCSDPPSAPFSESKFARVTG